MTLSELLALVGRSWSRLLIYPGGLTLAACAMLLYRLGIAAAPGARRLFGAWRPAAYGLLRALPAAPPLALIGPWLAVALMPLPAAVDLGRSIDAMLAVALLDLPMLYTLAAELRSPDSEQRTTGARRLAALLNGYPTLLLAFLLTSPGTLELVLLARTPAGSTLPALLHWVGAGALVLALPPLLGLGPWHMHVADAGLRLGMRLRSIGYWALALLPWLAPLERQLWQLVPPLAIALVLWGFHRFTKHQPAQRWARIYLVLDLLLLAALVAGAGWNLAQQLR